MLHRSMLCRVLPIFFFGPIAVTMLSLSAYCDNLYAGQRETLATQIRTHASGGSKPSSLLTKDLTVQQLSSLLGTEFKCQTGLAIATKHVQDLANVLAAIYGDVLRKGEMTAITERQLKTLQDELRNVAPCLKAVTELSDLVKTATRSGTVDKTVGAKRLAEKDLADRQRQLEGLKKEQKSKSEIEELKRLKAKLEQERVKLGQQIQEEKRVIAEVDDLVRRKSGLTTELERLTKERKSRPEIADLKRRIDDIKKQIETLRRQVRDDGDATHEKLTAYTGVPFFPLSLFAHVVIASTLQKSGNAKEEHPDALLTNDSHPRSPRSSLMIIASNETWNDLERRDKGLRDHIEGIQRQTAEVNRQIQGLMPGITEQRDLLTKTEELKRNIAQDTAELERLRKTRIQKAQVGDLKRQLTELTKQIETLKPQVGEQKKLSAEMESLKREYTVLDGRRTAKLRAEKERLLAEEQSRKREQAALELKKRAAELKSGRATPTTFDEAIIKFDAADGDEYVDRPPTSVPNDPRYLRLSGTVEAREGDIVICNAAESMFDEDRFQIRKWAFKSKGVGSYVPRINEDVKVIGKISGVIQGRTVVRKQIFMIVLDAVAVESDGRSFHQR